MRRDTGALARRRLKGGEGADRRDAPVHEDVQLLEEAEQGDREARLLCRGLPE